VTGTRGNLRILVAEFAAMFVLAAAILFVAAGTIAWPVGWAFLVLSFGLSAAMYGWLVRHDPGLVAERMTGLGRLEQSAWENAFIALTCVFFLAWLVLMPLDAVRFQWSHVPAVVQALGAVLLVGAFWLHFLTFRENSYLSPAIRIQSERGQKVIDTGPYRYVRHPMYTSLLGLTAGAALLLGSWLGLVAVPVLAIGLAARAMLEESMLARELPGYDEYMVRVRYRFVPYVW